MAGKNPFIELGKDVLKRAGKGIPNWMCWGGSISFLGGLALTAVNPVLGAWLLWGTVGAVSAVGLYKNGPELLCFCGGTALPIGLAVALVSPVGLNIAMYAAGAMILGAAWYWIRNKLSRKVRPQRNNPAAAQQPQQENTRGNTLTVTDNNRPITARGGVRGNGAQSGANRPHSNNGNQNTMNVNHQH